MQLTASAKPTVFPSTGRPAASGGGAFLDLVGQLSTPPVADGPPSLASSSAQAATTADPAPPAATAQADSSHALASETHSNSSLIAPSGPWRHGLESKVPRAGQPAPAIASRPHPERRERRLPTDELEQADHQALPNDYPTAAPLRPELLVTAAPIEASAVADGVASSPAAHAKHAASALGESFATSVQSRGEGRRQSPAATKKPLAAVNAQAQNTAIPDSFVDEPGGPSRADPRQTAAAAGGAAASKFLDSTPPTTSADALASPPSPPGAATQTSPASIHQQSQFSAEHRGGPRSSPPTTPSIARPGPARPSSNSPSSNSPSSNSPQPTVPHPTVAQLTIPRPIIDQQRVHQRPGAHPTRNQQARRRDSPRPRPPPNQWPAR